jgi:hypothetical protein
MHSQVSSNALFFSDADIVPPSGSRAHGIVSVFPSSPETGLAAIRTGGVVLLTTADVVALRDHLNLALEQAEGGHPFQVL